MDLMENKPTLIQVNSGLGITYYKHIIAPFTDACISYQASLSANNGLGMKQMSVYPSVLSKKKRKLTVVLCSSIKIIQASEIQDHFLLSRESKCFHNVTKRYFDALRWMQICIYIARAPRALYNIGYPSEIHLKLKSREISFAHNSCFSWSIALKFYTEHGSNTAVLCAKFQTEWTDVMDERDIAIFEFKMGVPVPIVRWSEGRLASSSL